MNSVKITATLTFLLSSLNAWSQIQETPDSIMHRLDEVEVTAKHPATKLVGSTLVSVITGTDLAQLGCALDVLQQLPLILVQDNSVSVIGKNNVEIYIDGRPMRNEIELTQLLSSNIKKIELIMAPGAAYDSTTDAVLRITTRRRFAEGLSINDMLQTRRRRKWSVMDNLSLNYRLGEWDIFANGMINSSNSLAKGSTANSLIYNDKTTVIGSSQRNAYPTTTVIAEAGFNFSGASRSFGAHYQYNPENGNFSNTGSEWIDSNPQLMRVVNKDLHARSHLASAYYEQIISGSYRIHFDGDFRQSSSRSNTSTIYSDLSASDVNSFDKRRSTLWAGKLNLDFPLASGEFNAGLQTGLTQTSLNYTMLNPEINEYIPSSTTETTQKSMAAYGSWSRIFGRFSLTAGVRWEYTDFIFKIDGNRDIDISRHFNLITPDLSIGYSFNDNSRITLSYKTSTVKPPYSQLTGSLNYVGQHEIEGGNPTLRDEKVHNMQLLGMWRGFFFQSSFLRSIDTYAFVKRLHTAHNLQVLMHPENINLSALTLFISWSQPVGRWSPNIALGIYRQWLHIDRNSYNKPIYSYYFDNTLSLPHGWLLTANISGRSQGDMHTNRFGATWFTMDASVGKVLLKKSLTIKLTATDLFNTANHNWTMDTYGIFVDKRQSYDRRGVSLNIIYSFQPRQNRYKGNPAAEEEIKRL